MRHRPWSPPTDSLFASDSSPPSSFCRIASAVASQSRPRLQWPASPSGRPVCRPATHVVNSLFTDSRYRAGHYYTADRDLLARPDRARHKGWVGQVLGHRADERVVASHGDDQLRYLLDQRLRRQTTIHHSAPFSRVFRLTCSPARQRTISILTAHK